MLLLFWKITILSGLNLMLVRKWTTGLELVSGEQIRNRIKFLKHSGKNILRNPGSKLNKCSAFPWYFTWTKLAYLQKFQFLLGTLRMYKIPWAWRNRQPKYTNIASFRIKLTVYVSIRWTHYLVVKILYLSTICFQIQNARTKSNLLIMS